MWVLVDHPTLRKPGPIYRRTPNKHQSNIPQSAPIVCDIISCLLHPSTILSMAVSGARMRLLFVSTMWPFWIISSRMMWTDSRLNMIWSHLKVKEKPAGSRQDGATETWPSSIFSLSVSYYYAVMTNESFNKYVKKKVFIKVLNCSFDE